MKHAYFPLFTLLSAVLLTAGCGTSAGNPLASAGSPSSERRILFYQCPMDPQVTSQDPKAKCTVCGMRLGPVYEEKTGTDSASAGTLKLSSATASVIGAETAVVKRGILKRTLRVAGFIAEDETKRRVLSARVPGRIEKLYVNQIGIEVAKDKPLAEIYSPDVLTAQRLYLENLRIQQKGIGAVTHSELATSREKLLAYGLEESDIARLEATGEPKKLLEILAPFDGTVIARQAFEGQYVEVNDHLFDIGDFSQLWFIFDAYEQDLPLLKINQKVEVTLTSLPNETVTAPITFIDPNLDSVTRTAKVRVVLPNPQRRILNRQTAAGVVSVESGEVLLLPRSAVLYTRSKPVVYVELDGGHYQLREVTLGTAGDECYEVLHGVEEEERVVSQAALLLDSQAQIVNVGFSAAAVHSADSMPEHGHEKQGGNPVPAKISKELPAALKGILLPPAFIESVLKITEDLAADKLDDYNKHLPDVQKEFKLLPEEVRKHLHPFAEKLKTGKTLKEVRTPFEPFSNAVADIVRSQEKNKRQAFLCQCPMSPVLGTARWIQRQHKTLLNPFFGSEMLHCGSKLD